MSTVETLEMRSSSLETTESLASAIGARLRGGEIITLSSDLGGGKTAFVRGLARGMGSPDHVSSPTFTLSREYNRADNKYTLYHFDFYRLSEPGIMALELAEIRDDPSAVLAVEWSGVVDGVLPDKRLSITFVKTGETQRRIIFDYPTELSYLLPKELYADINHKD